MKILVLNNVVPTWTDIKGCMVVDVPDDVEDVEEFLMENQYEPIMIEDMLREREKDLILGDIGENKPKTRKRKSKKA